jgi:hypothetical protein
MQSKIVKALTNLGIKNWTLYCENEDDIDTQNKFENAFKKTVSSTSDNQAVESSDPTKFGVTWTQVKAEMDKL